MAADVLFTASSSGVGTVTLRLAGIGRGSSTDASYGMSHSAATGAADSAGDCAIVALPCAAATTPMTAIRLRAVQALQDPPVRPNRPSIERLSSLLLQRTVGRPVPPRLGTVAAAYLERICP